MKVCILNPGSQELTQHFRAALRQALPGVRIDTCGSQTELAQQCRPVSSDILAVVALAANAQELQDLRFLEEWPSKPKLLLVLPSNAPEIVALGHRLRPAFVSYIWEGFAAIAGVLAHLVNRKTLDAGKSGTDFQEMQNSID